MNSTKVFHQLCTAAGWGVDSGAFQASEHHGGKMYVYRYGQLAEFKTDFDLVLDAAEAALQRLKSKFNGVEDICVMLCNEAGGDTMSGKLKSATVQATDTTGEDVLTIGRAIGPVACLAVALAVISAWKRAEQHNGLLAIEDDESEEVVAFSSDKGSVGFAAGGTKVPKGSAH